MAPYNSQARTGSPDNGTRQGFPAQSKSLLLKTRSEWRRDCFLNRRMRRTRHHRSPRWKIGTFFASAILGSLTLGFGPLAQRAHPAPAQAQPRSLAPPPISLEISYSQVGRVLEVKGHASLKAAVMVNGDVVPAVGDDGSFTYFTPPLPEGENLLTVTAQDQLGQSITRQLHVEVQ